MVDPSRETVNYTQNEEERVERASSNQESSQVSQESQAKQSRAEQSKASKKVRWPALMEVRPPASVRAGPLLSRSPRAPARAHQHRTSSLMSASTALARLATISAQHSRSPTGPPVQMERAPVASRKPIRGRQLVRSRASSRRPSAQPQLLKHPAPVRI